MSLDPPNTLYQLTESPLDISAISNFVRTPTAGGIVIFLGTTRAEKSPDGRPLIALMYEAYPAMADRVCRAIIEEARARWPIERCAIVHRIGRVELADPSVIIAVACPHRAEAFEACRYLIDQLKQRAPIWKEPIWT
jgi:molybdopterin synthase catalytic subunit